MCTALTDKKPEEMGKLKKLSNAYSFLVYSFRVRLLRLKNKKTKKQKKQNKKPPPNKQKNVF